MTNILDQLKHGAFADPRVFCSVPIGISYDSDIDKARAILLELARQHPQAREVSGCSVTQFGPAGVVLPLGAWCADSSTTSVLKGDLLEQAAKRFAAEGLKLPFPQRVVTLIPPETTLRAPFKSSPS